MIQIYNISFSISGPLHAPVYHTINKGLRHPGNKLLYHHWQAARIHPCKEDSDISQNHRQQKKEKRSIGCIACPIDRPSREIEPIRSDSTRPAKWTAPRKNRPTATPLLFFVYANPPDLHSVPYIQRYEQIRNRCFLLNRFLRRRKQERIMCSRWFSFRREYDRESVTSSAGLYRVRAVWIFPVPEIPARQQISNRVFLR